MGIKLGRAHVQVSQGRGGEGRERFVIVRLHPALEGDGESEHAHLRPEPSGQFVRAGRCAQGTGPS
jgi:hypothetical protein